MALLNANPSIDGILLQLPLPSHLRELTISQAVSFDKASPLCRLCSLLLTPRKGRGRVAQGEFGPARHPTGITETLSVFFILLLR